MCFSSSGRPLNRKIITGRVEWNSPNEWHCSVIFHRTFTRIFGIIFLKNSNNTEHYVNFMRTKWRNSSTCPLIRLNRPVVSSRWRWNMQRFIGRENFSTREDVALSGGRSSWLLGREETRDAGRWRPTTALRAQHSICCFHSALHLNGLNWFIEIFHVTRSLHISGWWANKRRVYSIFPTSSKRHQTRNMSSIRRMWQRLFSLGVIVRRGMVFCTVWQRCPLNQIQIADSAMFRPNIFRRVVLGKKYFLLKIYLT